VRDRVQGVKFSALAGGAFWNIYELKVTQDWGHKDWGLSRIRSGISNEQGTR
jgi:hypothetical protein